MRMSFAEKYGEQFPLHVAVAENRRGAVREAKEAAEMKGRILDPNLVDTNGDTPAQIAVMKGLDQGLRDLFLQFPSTRVDDNFAVLALKGVERHLITKETAESMMKIIKLHVDGKLKLTTDIIKKGSLYKYPGPG